MYISCTVISGLVSIATTRVEYTHDDVIGADTRDLFQD